MGGEQDQGFVIRDRRGRGSDESSSRDTSPPPRPEAAPPRDKLEEARHEPQVPPSFSSLVISMGTSALMLLGEQLDPKQRALPVNLPQAKEIIDLLSVLEEKTRGNLNADEQSVLTDMLYALRIKYVNLASGTQPTHPS